MSLKSTPGPSAQVQPDPQLPEPERVRELVQLFEQRHADALAAATRMTQQHPRFSLGWQILGLTLGQAGRASEALVPMRKAVELAPGDAAACLNLGLLLQHLGDESEAEACLLRALRLRPGFAPAHFALAVGLLRRDRLEEACASFRGAIEADPGLADAHNDLGATHERLGRIAEAEACYRNALKLRPDYPEANNNLANLLAQACRLHEAEDLYRRALQARPNFAQAYDNLGATLQDLGRFSEAQASYRQALQLDAGFVKAHSDLLLCMNFSHHPVSDYLEEAVRYGRTASARVSRRYDQWHCASDSGRLRVGMVSGDLREHPVGYFLEGLLEHVDSDRIELYAYPSAPYVDDLTRRIQPRFAAWKPIFRLADDAAAQTVHADGVHILVDLAGHTANNRLGVFAYKAAPVQASWLGYFASTGLSEIDWMLLDRVSAPEQDTEAFTEKIYRLPGPRYCFTAPATDAPVRRLPAASRGYVTFCCFNTLNKVNEAVVALWARVLVAVPGSRLFLKAKLLQDPLSRSEVIRRFADQGVAPERLELEGRSPRSEYLESYGRADIVLDPFPYTGGTTSLEALWMGVPVLTLKGDRLLSRQGAAILTHVGLQDWIAEDPDDFVRRAADRARDVQSLEDLRCRLRGRLAASPLMDAARFARDFQAALWDIWDMRSPGLCPDAAGG